MDILLGICVGIGLSAACGFRIFVPLLIVSIATKSGYFTPSANFSWLGSNIALITFSIATVLEILAYYIPWLDNFLDSIATPIAIVAGVVVMASSLGELNPYLKWTLAIIAGGGVAGSIQFLTAGTRAASTTLTGGIGNPIISTLEAIASLILSVLTILIPLVAILLVIIIFFIVIVIYAKRKA